MRRRAAIERRYEERYEVKEVPIADLKKRIKWEAEKPETAEISSIEFESFNVRVVFGSRNIGGICEYGVEEGKKSPLNCKAVAFWKTAADTVNMI